MCCRMFGWFKHRNKQTTEVIRLSERFFLNTAAISLSYCEAKHNSHNTHSHTISYNHTNNHNNRVYWHHNTMIMCKRESNKAIKQQYWIVSVTNTESKWSVSNNKQFSHSVCVCAAYEFHQTNLASSQQLTKQRAL